MTMPYSSRVPCFFAFALLAHLALAQSTITGTATNKTTGKPASGDTVTLIRLAQGMQESTVTHTDARGHYKIELPDEGIHLIRVTHDKANYFGAAPPGTTTVDVAVYDAAPEIDGVTTQVEELHFEATANELHVVEVLEVENKSSPARTQFGPGGFDFYLPENAHIERTAAVTDAGMPVPASAAPLTDHAGHYTFLFPIRPGETQFGIFYSLPYTGSAKLDLRLARPITTLALLLPKSMTLTPDANSGIAPGPANDPGTQMFMTQNPSPAQALQITVSGTGSLPQQQAQSTSEAPADANAVAQLDANGRPDPTKFGGGLGKPIDPNDDHDPWAKYKWYILGGLTLLLAAAAGALLRKPAPAEIPAASSSTPVRPIRAASHEETLRDMLKEEMFTLETERLQNKISEADYASHKQALNTVLLRALLRSQPSPAASTKSSEPS